jgi:broad specificity phosphatase PhoE
VNTSNNGNGARATIHLVRHAKSAYVHHGRWMDIGGLDKFEADYNAAGIRDDSVPSKELIETAAQADIIAASDMLRAILSAKRLVPARDPDVSPLLREIFIDPPRWVPVRLPIHYWDLYNYAKWSFRLRLALDHEEVRRARQAVDWLLERARGPKTLVAITHGGFRRILDAQLLAHGCQRVPGPLSYRNWSTWSYTI